MCTPYKIAPKKLFQYFYFVGEIVECKSFDNFYVLQTDSDDVKLEQATLRDEMQNFYANHESPIDILNVGSTVAVLVEGVWRRCVVTKLLQDHDCEVFAVDLGLHIVVAQEQLRSLKPPFLQTPQATISCCLADIAPKDMKLGYSKRAIRAFKKTVTNTERSVKIEVISDITDYLSRVSVLIYVLLGAEKKVNVNAMLAENFDCVKSTGKESNGTIVDCDEDELPEKPIVKRAKKIIETPKRLEVKIIHIVDPSEFYAIPIHHIKDVKKLRESINQHMATKKDRLPMKIDTKYMINGLCLAAYPDKNGNIRWHRAKVISLVSDHDPQIFNVLLVDEGWKLNVEAKNVFEVPKFASCVPAGVIKMKMAGARPTTGDQWSFTSIDQFKELSRRFESYYVSIVGNRDEGGFPVIVWGTTTEEIKIVTQKQFHNLTAYLSYYGFIDCYATIESEDVVNVERSVSDETFGWMANNPSNAQAHRVVFEEVTETEVTLAAGLTMSLVPRTLNAWIPGETVSAGKFAGLVTNVDEDGHLSIQKKRQQAVMKEMTDKLTSYYLTLPTESSLLIPKGGQSVVIFKELDAKFYRGRIEALPTKYDDYKITLVDFGTVEYVKKENIFTNVIAANVPIQSQRFRLASVVPLEKCGNEWPKETLKFLDEELVDCDVRVDVTLAGDVSECLIYVLNEGCLDEFIDIEKLLTSKNLAVARQATSSWPPMKKAPPKKSHQFDAMDPKKLLELDETKKFLRDIEEYSQPRTADVPISKTRDFLHRIKEDFNDEIARLVMLLKSQPHTKMLQPLTQKPFDPSHKWRHRQRKMATMPTEYDFERIFLKKKRVLVNRRKHVGIKSPANIFFFDMQAAEIAEFPCYFVSTLGYKKIYIKPMIEELTVKSRELDEFMKTFDSQLLVKFGEYEMVERKLCVVNDDSVLKRGRIISDDDIDALEVFLIDFAEVRLFSMNNVFKMPMKLRNFPCQIMIIMLKGVSVGPKAWGENDIVQRLPELLQGHFMTAVVQGHDYKDYPQVDLLIDGKRALQPLINEKLCIFNEDLKEDGDEDEDSFTMKF